MKTAPRFYTGNPDTVLAYQPVDLEKFNAELRSRRTALESGVARSRRHRRG